MHGGCAPRSGNGSEVALLSDHFSSGRAVWDAFGSAAFRRADRKRRRGLPVQISESRLRVGSCAVGGGGGGHRKPCGVAVGCASCRRRWRPGQGEVPLACP